MITMFHLRIWVRFFHNAILPCMHAGHSWHAIYSMKISNVLSTSRPGRTCLQKFRGCVKTFAPFCDGSCVWSGYIYGVGTHIIPFKRGSDVRSIIIRLECLIISVPLANTQWLRLIIENRPKYEERLASLRSCKVDKFLT